MRIIMRKRICFLLGIVIFQLLIWQSNADNFNKAKERPFACTAFMQKPPEIDGKINEGEWDTLQVNGLIGRDDGIEPRTAIFWIGSDRRELYIAMQSEFHPEHGMLTRLKPMNDDDIPVLMDDSIEIWIDPVTNNPNKKDSDNFFQIAFNASGAIDDMAIAAKDGKINKKWRGKYKIASSMDKNIWTCELAVDLKSLGINENSFSFPWGIRVNRNWKMPWVQGKWNPATLSFIDSKTMPLIRFVDNAPIIQQLSYQNNAKTEVDIEVRLKNPGNTKMELAVSLGHNEIHQPRYYQKEKITLPPGKEEIVKYEFQVPDPNNYQGISEIEVKSSDGSICFLRDYAWQMRPKGRIWDITGAQKTAVFDLGYYPYHKKIKVRIDVSTVDFRKQLEEMIVKVTPHGKDEILFEKRFPASSNSNIIEEIIEIPELKNGSYDVKIYFKVAGKILEKPLIEMFERYHFPWEHNQLGISDEVIPPFTPIELDGKVVKTILRDHEMSPIGLWSQVKSKGQDLLATPMELQLSSEGKRLRIKTNGLEFTTVKPNLLKGYSNWETNKFQGKTCFEYDYDGMMKVILELTPKVSVAIDCFRMVIPLKTPSIPLMHVIADGIRITEAKGLTEKQGVVWRSQEVNRGFIKAPFVPYIWIGGPERGICWFADTDKGWILNREKDSALIIRENGVTSLVIDFINSPTQLDKPLKVVFGLQATPVKPMPSNWRQWGATENHPFKWMWFGAEAYWSGANVALWPYKNDFIILDKYRQARETGKTDWKFFDNLFNNFDYHEWYKPKHEAAKHFRTHVSSGYSKIANFKPDALTAYTNVTGALMSTPEWWTFQDEWTFDAYRLRDARTDERETLKLNETGTCLSKSRIDFMLWQYKKLMEALMDGIYWDNMYPHAVRDPMNGEAYKLPDGSVQSSVNIFAMRELVKRTAVLAHKMGKPRANMVHMTTANLIPVYSFADMTLDWEWKYGMDDFQERFPAEFILTESTGLQTGCIPFVLAGMLGDATKERKEFVRRTYIGWTLVHELKSESLDSFVYKIIYDFGYGDSDCHVFNWWESEPTVKMTGAEAKYLLLSKKNRLLLIICSSGEGGEVTVSFTGKMENTAKECLRALNVESKQTIPITEGKFSFKLPKHDYRIFILSKD